MKFSRCFFSTVLLWLLAAPMAGSAAESPRRLVLAGAINDKLEIRMTLLIDGATVTGTYCYLKHNTPIPLSGAVASDGALTLTETGPKGKPTGRFEAMLTPANTITGTWYSPDGSKSYAFRVREENPTASGLWPPAGEWSGEVGNASMDIGNVTSHDFGFYILAYRGDHVGEVYGKAVKAGGKAEWRDPEGKCNLVFEPKGKSLEVTTPAADCSAYAGAGVTFEGVYTRDQAPDH